MKKLLSFLFVICLFINKSYSQNVAINATGAAPVASAMLDITSTTSGLLMPRMTSVQRVAIASPATGLNVYDTTTNTFWWFNGVIWVEQLGTVNGWALVGNSLAGTEFMGSTNAQPVRFFSNNTERARFISSGEFVVGNTVPVTGDVFSSYASGVNIAIASYGTGTSPTLYSQNVGGGGHAIQAITDANTAFGVLGMNTNATANPAHGVQGQTTGFSSASGVRGFNIAAAIGAAQSGFGVRGSCNVIPTGTGFVMGVRGDCAGASGSTYGVYGQVASATGFGMNAANTNASGTGFIVTGNGAGGTYLPAGSGIASNGNGIGIFSIAKTAASGVGIVGIGNNLTGSIFVPTSGCGVTGTGAQYGIMGFATTVVNTSPLGSSAANGAAASAGGYFEVQAAGVPQTWAYVGVRDNTATLRKIIGPGTVNTIVKNKEGNLVSLTCPEAPENLFQDYGQGQLINGKAHVVIDPIFAMNILVNEKHPLRVFIQLEGNCKGVFVTRKSANGFDVEELDGGTSNTPFMFTIVANRANEVNPDGSIAKYAEERFPAAPGPQKTTIAKTFEENSGVKDVTDDQPIPTAIKKTNSKK